MKKEMNDLEQFAQTTQNIAIIGAGQLGSRHLQGLKKANLDMSIFVVDTNPESLVVSKERYEEIEPNLQVKSIDYLASIDFLPFHLDLVIIATNSISRADLAKQILSSKKVKNIVFEKFLFPRISDYENINQLLIDYNVNAWVNCPRRMFSYYNEIKHHLKDIQDVHFSVVGEIWGLGCNSIHFIDIFSWLIEEEDFSLDLSFLNRNIQKSKRDGYIEFIGTINGQFKSGKKFILTSNEPAGSPHVIQTISTNKYDIIIDESAGKYILKYKSNAQIEERNIQMLFQSQLTGVLAEKILQEGDCPLTKYSKSSRLHINFLTPILEFYNDVTRLKSDICPIT